MTAVREFDLINTSLRAAHYDISEQVKLWANYSNEKADVAETLMKVIRDFGSTYDTRRPLRALSIGSSDEPQFEILQSAFKGGLYLFDADQKALNDVDKRVERQMLSGVTTVRGDYIKAFADKETARRTLAEQLGGQRFELITLHHSLYYLEKRHWKNFIEILAETCLALQGTIHVVMMSAREEREDTTTWLYNRFAEKFFGHRNDQDLLELKAELIGSPALAGAEIASELREVRFYNPDFEKFMAVVWMIMLHPQVHDFNLEQMEEVTDHVFQTLWRQRRSLIQTQDSLTISRSLDPRPWRRSMLQGLAKTRGILIGRNGRRPEARAFQSAIELRRPG